MISVLNPVLAQLNYTDQKAVLLSVYIEPDINVTVDEENA